MLPICDAEKPEFLKYKNSGFFSIREKCGQEFGRINSAVILQIKEKQSKLLISYNFYHMSKEDYNEAVF